jgi:hypothetical protein
LLARARSKLFSWIRLLLDTKKRSAVIGWLYVFGGRSGARQVVAASVVDRLVFVPAVLLPLAIGGVFPHFLVTLAILDPALAIGA